MKKFLKWFFIGIFGLVLLLFGAGALILNTSIKDKLIAKYSEPYLNADLRVDRIRLRFLTTLPDVSLTLCDTRLLRPGTDERIASIDTLCLRANLFSCLHKNYEVKKLLLDGIYADYRECDTTLVKKQEKKEETAVKEKSTGLSLPEFSADVQIRNCDISYLDLLSHAHLDLAATASNNAVDGATAHISSLKASAFGAVLSAKADGYRLLSQNPSVTLSLKSDAELSSLRRFIPESILARGKVHLKADGTLTKKEADIFASLSSPLLEASMAAGKVEIQDFKFEAGAHEGVEKLPERKRPEGLELPDFLKEEDFRKADIELQIDSSLARMIKTWNPRAKIHLGQTVIQTPRVPLKNTLKAFDASVNINEVNIDKLMLRSGVSDLSVTGSLKGLSSLFGGHGKGFYRLDLNAKSQFLNLNQILIALDRGAEATRTEAPIDLDEDVKTVTVTDADSLDVPGLKLFVIPANVKADVNIYANLARYRNITASRLNARARVDKRCVLLSDVKGTTPMGSVAADAFYSTVTKDNIGAGVNVKLRNISVEKVLDLVPALDTLIPVLSSFKGRLNCELAATTQLDTTFAPLMSTANGAFRFTGDKLSLDQQGNFKKIARILLFRDRKKGVIEHLDICGVVHDNELTVFPFDLSLDRYSLALGGSQNFGGKFDYKVSLMRSPLILRFGVNLKGADFDHLKFRLIRSQFKAGQVPTFHDEVDQMLASQRQAILSSITRGSDNVIRAERRATARMLKKRSDDITLINTVEDLPEDQVSQLDSLSRVPEPAEEVLSVEAPAE